MEYRSANEDMPQKPLDGGMGGCRLNKEETDKIRLQKTTKRNIINISKVVFCDWYTTGCFPPSDLDRNYGEWSVLFPIPRKSLGSHQHRIFIKNT